VSQCSYPHYSPAAVLSLPGKYSAFTTAIFPIATRPRLEHLIHSLDLDQHCGASATRLYSTSSTALSNMAEFMFVNLNNPTQNKRREVRKLVRSHVSYIQHSQKRTELGQVQKPSKSRYTDRSVNGWAVLDDRRAGHLSQRKSNTPSGVTPHQSISPGADPIRIPRQLYNDDLPAVGSLRRCSRQSQGQPRNPPAPPTPMPTDEVNAKKESPQAVSTLPKVKSETAVTTTPERVIIKQEPGYETDQRRDIISQHSSPSLRSASTFGRDGEDDQLPYYPFPLLHPSLGDPTDELRIRIEVLRVSLPSIMVLSLRLHSPGRNRVS
jgi:hypothetical protein